MREFVDLDTDEASTEHAGNRQPPEGAAQAILLHLQHRETVGDRREQQHRGVDRHEWQVEQLRACLTTRIASTEHTVHGEQTSEHEAIAHQVQPEPEQRTVLGVMFYGKMEAPLSGGSGGSVESIKHGPPSAACERAPREPPLLPENKSPGRS